LQLLLGLSGQDPVVETKTLKLPIIANNITNVFVDIVKFLRFIRPHSSARYLIWVSPQVSKTA